MTSITHLHSASTGAWNALVAREPSFGLLQTWEWGDFKEALGWQAYRLAVQQNGEIVAGAQMLIKMLVPGLASIAYIPRGPVGDWQDPAIAQPLFREIHQVARKHKAIFLKSEPPLLNGSPASQVIGQLGFRHSDYSNQPRATIILDLSSGLDAILARMHHKARYNIRLAAKKGVKIHLGSSADLETFLELMQITGGRGGFTPRGMAYYRSLWEIFAPLDRLRLFVATYQEKILAMNMSAVYGQHAVYLYGAASGEDRQLQPNSLLMWEAIRWAKSCGCMTFDFWGIPDEVGRSVIEGNPMPRSDRTDELWGVYEFKRKFSENIVYYMGAFDYVYNHAFYSLISNRYFNLNTFEKLSSLLDRLNRPGVLSAAPNP